MTRRVGDLGFNSTIQGAGGLVDTYARPIKASEGSLEYISEQLNKWNPAFINYSAKRAEEQYQKEVSEGKAIAFQYSGKTLPEIEEILKNNSSDESFRQLSIGHKNGINTAQMQVAMARTNTTIADMYQTAVDENGTPLSESEDPNAFDKWFNKAYSDEWQKETGGTYDRRLYGEVVQNEYDQLRNQLQAQYFQKKGQCQAVKSDRVHSQLYDAVFAPIYKASTEEPETAIMKGREAFNDILELRTANGDTVHAIAFGREKILQEMETYSSPYELNFLKEIARGTIVWADPESRRRIEAFADNKKNQYEAELRREKEDQRSDVRWYRESKQYEQRQLALDFIREYSKGDINTLNSNLQELYNDPRVKDNPEIYSYINAYVKTNGQSVIKEREAVRNATLGVMTEEEATQLLTNGDIDKRVYDDLIKTIRANKSWNNFGMANIQHFEKLLNEEDKNASPEDKESNRQLAVAAAALVVKEVKKKTGDRFNLFNQDDFNIQALISSLRTEALKYVIENRDSILADAKNRVYNGAGNVTQDEALDLLKGGVIQNPVVGPYIKYLINDVAGGNITSFLNTYSPYRTEIARVEDELQKLNITLKDGTPINNVMSLLGVIQASGISGKPKSSPAKNNKANTKPKSVKPSNEDIVGQ